MERPGRDALRFCPVFEFGSDFVDFLHFDVIIEIVKL